MRRRRRAAEAKGARPTRGGSAEIRCAENDDAAEIDDDGFGTGAAILRDLEEAGMAMVGLSCTPILIDVLRAFMCVYFL